MKKIIKKSLIVLVLCFFLFQNTVFANSSNDISLRLENSIYVQKNKTVLFKMLVDNFGDFKNISWKIRAECSGFMSIKIQGLASNICYKNKNINIEDGSFSFSLKKQNKVAQKFSVALYAYDEDGNLLHTEKEVFHLK